jgi:SAM-dependent methyltransferase
MTTGPDWVPPGIDTGKANIARVYDYWLGGTSNFLADQDAARALLALEPNARGFARANRAFLGRAVRYLAGHEGIRQFLDIGSGIPTAGNVHEVAQETAPGCHVVYADVDEVVIAHSKLLLKDQPDTVAIQADLRQPEKILADPAVRAMIDFGRPVALLLVAVLHFIPDEDDPWRLVATLRQALAPGSYLVVCHACRDARPELAAPAEKAYEGRVKARAAIRTRAEILRFFGGFEILDPGLVYLPLWRPDSPADIPEDPRNFWGLAGVGRLTGKS